MIVNQLVKDCVLLSEQNKINLLLLDCDYSDCYSSFATMSSNLLSVRYLISSAFLALNHYSLEKTLPKLVWLMFHLRSTKQLSCFIRQSPCQGKVIKFLCNIHTIYKSAVSQVRLPNNAMIVYKLPFLIYFLLSRC